MLDFYLHLVTTGISDKLQLLFKDKSCMWLFRTNPSIPAQNPVTFLLLTSATELSAFFFSVTWPFAENIIILTNKKCTTNRITYRCAHKAGLCYQFESLLFTCNVPVLLCLPSSMIITLLFFQKNSPLDNILVFLHICRPSCSQLEH